MLDKYWHYSIMTDDPEAMQVHLVQTENEIIQLTMGHATFAFTPSEYIEFAEFISNSRFEVIDDDGNKFIEEQK